MLLEIYKLKALQIYLVLAWTACVLQLNKFVTKLFDYNYMHLAVKSKW